jgi:hypothetical protein
MVLKMIRQGRLIQKSHISAEAKSLKTRVEGLSNYHSNKTAVEAARWEASGLNKGLLSQNIYSKETWTTALSLTE